ncbi:gag-pol polyprotein [Lasius niger]|uniref:Gag-pol polyprotein n=1 Tax=Lasius niger TaxID=67767 RepID=A0A0J7MXW6_LASNI|nr:gag-pol polyprotein [Lasius niger]
MEGEVGGKQGAAATQRQSSPSDQRKGKGEREGERGEPKRNHPQPANPDKPRVATKASKKKEEKKKKEPAAAAGKKQQQQLQQATRKAVAAASTKQQQQQQQPTDPKAATSPGTQQESWATAVGKKAKRAGKKAEQAVVALAKVAAKNGEKGKAPVVPNVDQRARKKPKTAVVTVSCPPGRYEETMKEARAKLNLNSLGITGVRIKRAITGALIFEIPGKESAKLADTLATNLRKVFVGRKEVRVKRPTKMAELRLRGLEDSITPQEIATAVAINGGCEPEEVKVGDIQMSPNGISTVWVRCPLYAANKVVAADRIQMGWIGWTLVAAQLLDNRPLQCFKCLEGGHVRKRCPNNVDRSRLCYRCGAEGHEAKSCREAHCIVCKAKNLPANHRSGGKACPSIKKGMRGLALNRMTKSQPTPPVAVREETRRPASSAAGRASTPIPTQERRKAEEEVYPPAAGGNKRRRLREDVGKTDFASDIEAEREKGPESDQDDL